MRETQLATREARLVTRETRLATHKTRLIVIPAKAGIHVDRRYFAKWIPAFAGMTKWAL
jgi:hypothetical protein